MTVISCDYCGEDFNKKPSLIEKTDNDFCSNECRGQWNSENRSGENHPQYNRISVNCTNCGDEKEVTPSHHEKVENHFCDPDCQAEYEDRSEENNPSWKGGKETVNCTYCSKEFKVYQWRYEEEKDFFCDVNCRGSWATESFSGKSHPLWEGYSADYGGSWLSVRKEVRQRDNGECQICGVDKEKLGQWPDVHHIEPVKNFDDPDEANFPGNLISLCSSCHGKVEQGEIQAPKPSND